MSPQIIQKIYKPAKPQKFIFPWKKFLGYFFAIAALATLVAIFYPWEKYFFQKFILRRPESSIVSVKESGTKRQNKKDIYFKLETNDVSIVAPIVEGVDENDLKRGIGHHPETPWPDEKTGNVILAGHSSDIDPNNDYGKVFKDLNKAKIGDNVQIVYPESTYIYKIVSRNEISPSDTTFFGQDAGPRLTFYTCSPVFTNWRRLVYIASLTEIKNSKK